MKTLALLLVLGLFSIPASADDSTVSGAYGTDQAKEDYRAFLKKLKELNAEYKHITGEMAQVIKEEGVPTWDAGNLGAQIDEIFPQEPQLITEGVAIKETDKEVVVTVDLPGIQKKSLKTSVQEGNRLTIKAEKKTEAEAKKVEKWVQLPSPVDPKSGRAKYEDGVLTMRLKKVSPQEIPIPVE